MESKILAIGTKNIDKMIDQYEHVNGHEPSYIIMNKWTLDKFILNITMVFEPGKVMFLIYKNIPIAVCEKLKDGEIEVV